MQSTGDVRGCLRKLESLLRIIKYPGNVDYNSLSQGDPAAFLPIVSFTLTSFSPPFAEQLMAAGLELTGKSDLRFTDTFYKALRDIFHNKPVLSKQQFLQPGFSQRKISLVCDVITLVLQKHNQLHKGRVRHLGSQKDRREDARPTQTEAETVCVRPFVVKHIDNLPTFPVPSGGTLPSAGHMAEELEAEQEDKENVCNLSSRLEERLSAVEARLERLSGLQSLGALEKRLEDLEWQRNADKINTKEMISVPRDTWENLLSRVLLLETKLELSQTLEEASGSKTKASPQRSCLSSSAPDAPQEGLRDSLERITIMLKNTSSLLKNTDASSTAC
ncbi:centrosomal protein of 44 kDa [Nelusetta ayraudi]|uniref:centrosomal protein of 44 kDa n=1 Tax=Nelusetta ayraudi TaxID=303726 RepID=UPI003F717118